MTKINIEKIVRDLIDTFLDAGEISINLRNSGLTNKIKLAIKNEPRNKAPAILIIVAAETSISNFSLNF